MILGIEWGGGGGGFWIRMNLAIGIWELNFYDRVFQVLGMG